MSEDDLKRGIDNADGRVRVWLVLAAYAGLRCIEITALYGHDILDGADPPVLIAHGEGNKDRAVPMCQRVIDELQAFGMPRRGPLFPRLDGRPGPTGANRVTDILSQHFAELGIDGRAHNLAPPIWHRDLPGVAGHPRRAGAPRPRVATDHRRLRRVQPTTSCRRGEDARPDELREPPRDRNHCSGHGGCLSTAPGSAYLD